MPPRTPCAPRQHAALWGSGHGGFMHVARLETLAYGTEGDPWSTSEERLRRRRQPLAGFQWTAISSLIAKLTISEWPEV